MEWFVPGFLYVCIVSIVIFYFFCQCCSMQFRWMWGIIYTAFSFGLFVCLAMTYITSFFYILLEISLLTLCGFFMRKCKLIQVITFSALAISVYSIMEGMTLTFSYWIIDNSNPNSLVILKYADHVRNILTIILMIITFQIILKFFSNGIQGTYNLIAFPVMVIPVIFITLVEATISANVYGDTVIWDTTKGLVFPVVNNAELLILRFLSFISLFSVLAAYQKLAESIKNEQAMKVLEQQMNDQEIYVREAQMRYEQTQAFRHDIKNHLLVLKQLLEDEEPGEAKEYLRNLEQVSESISFPVNTGNAAVNALVGSKLAVAVQKGIHFSCSVVIPQNNGISDMDWCIVLANALDNAIKASNDRILKNRFIYLSGKQKGNFYLLSMENSCEDKRELPMEGTGLSNIKAVARKYRGRTEIEIVEGIYKLNVLFVISQQ